MVEQEPDAYEVLQVRPNALPAVIQAAYRALAALSHPDKNSAPGAERRMAVINAAYEAIRTQARRELYDRMLAAARAVPAPAAVAFPPPAPRAQATKDGDIIDFGRYAGWSITDLSREDPDYLRWLARHSSGIRYRSRIESALREPVRPTASERMRGR
jgi:curved DNA-binding protein CbpA